MKPLVHTLALCFWFIPVCTFAQTSGLIVLAPHQAPSTTIAYDFGLVDPINTKLLKCVFRLRNMSSNPITITQIQPTCGCTTTLLSSSDVSNNSTVNAFNKAISLPPNQTITLKAIVQIAHLNPGSFTKYIYVFTNNNDAPAVSIELKGTLLTLIQFDPPVIDFGTIPFGKPHTALLTVRIDQRLVNSDTAPAIYSSTAPSLLTEPTHPTDLPFIKIKPYSKPSLVQQHGRAFLQEVYQIILAPQAPLGSLQGTLYCKLPAPFNAISSYAAYLKGKVVGSFQCDPHVIVLGSVFQGQTAYDQTILHTTRPDLWQGLTITTSAPYLKAWLVPVPPNAATSPPDSRTLEVQVAPNAPVGALNLHVLLKASDGERMDIPVYINVEPKSRN